MGLFSLVRYFIGLTIFLWAGFYIWFDFLTKYIKSNFVKVVEIFKGFDLNKIFDLVWTNLWTKSSANTISNIQIYCNYIERIFSHWKIKSQRPDCNKSRYQDQIFRNKLQSCPKINLNVRLIQRRWACLYKEKRKMKANTTWSQVLTRTICFLISQSVDLTFQAWTFHLLECVRSSLSVIVQFF